jgi:hypothetical protein
MGRWNRASRLAGGPFPFRTHERCRRSTAMTVGMGVAPGKEPNHDQR